MSTAPTAPTRRARSPRRARAAAILLVLVGVLALLYPVVTTQYNNHRQHEFAEQYGRQVAQMPHAPLDAAFARAERYNRGLRAVPILDPWLTKVERAPVSGSYRTYLGHLADLDVMARVRVPSVDIDLPVRHGTGSDALTRGVGHLYGTSLPVGGAGTHSVLTSHTGLTDATLFDHLEQVAKGDVMFIDVAGRTLAYRVDHIDVVLPTEISDLTSVAGHDYLTLFTCTPYAVNTHRLLVRGERIPYTPELAGGPAVAAPADLSMAAWMWWMLLGAAVGLAVVTAIAVAELRTRRRRAVAGSAGDAGATEDHRGD